MAGTARRIAVIGNCGAGKSTFSRRLGQITGLPVTHLDEVYWRPGWQRTPRIEWRTLQQDLIASPEWVIDGNYGGTFDIRLPAADTVIVLDYSTARCLRQTLLRVLRNHGQATQAPACPERFDLRFLGYVTLFRRQHRPGLLEALERYADRAEVVMLRTPAMAESYLSRLGGRPSKQE